VTFIWRFLLFTVCITSLKQADLISDPIMHLQLLHPSLSVIYFLRPYPTPPDFQRALNPPSSGVFWEEAHATPPGGAQDSAHLQHKLLRAKPLVAIILRKKEGNRYGHGYRIISSNKHLFKIARIKFSINVVYSIVEEIQRNLQILCFRTTHFVLLSFIGEIVCFSGVKESECLGPQSVSILRGFLFGVSFERGLPA
jgi:hypothetical protein